MFRLTLAYLGFHIAAYVGWFSNWGTPTPPAAGGAAKRHAMAVNVSELFSEYDAFRWDADFAAQSDPWKDALPWPFMAFHGFIMPTFFHLFFLVVEGGIVITIPRIYDNFHRMVGSIVNTRGCLALITTIKPSMMFAKPEGSGHYGQSAVVIDISGVITIINFPCCCRETSHLYIMAMLNIMLLIELLLSTATMFICMLLLPMLIFITVMVVYYHSS